MSIEVVKQLFEAFGEGDLPGILSLVSEDCQWDHRGPYAVPIGKLFVGPEGVGEFFKVLSDTQETLEFEAREFFGSGNRVVVLGYQRFRVIETGKEWASDYAMAWTLEDGLVTHWRPIHDMGAEAVAHQP
jgi:ketosteroid isomerase-like protein